MTISVIIPCFNYEQYVGEAIKSCLDQKCGNYKVEIIVVDDCSKDGSRAVVEKYEDRGVILMCTKRNSGYSKAKNDGIERSTGEYIACLDADDMLTPDSLRLRARWLDFNQRVDMVHALAYSIYGDYGYEFIKERIYKLRYKDREKIHAQTVMVRRKVYQKYGLYDEDLRSRSDNEMWYRLRNIAGIRMNKIDNPVAFYRKHPKSMVQYRKIHKNYNDKVTSILLQKKHLRETQGITEENTRFLKL